MPTQNTDHIKWYNNESDMAFCAQNLGNRTCFFSSTAVDANESQTLGASQYVSYDLVQGGRGLQADHIKVIF